MAHENQLGSLKNFLHECVDGIKGLREESPQLRDSQAQSYSQIVGPVVQFKAQMQAELARNASTPMFVLSVGHSRQELLGLNAKLDGFLVLVMRAIQFLQQGMEELTGKIDADGPGWAMRRYPKSIPGPNGSCPTRTFFSI